MTIEYSDYEAPPSAPHEHLVASISSDAGNIELRYNRYGHGFQLAADAEGFGPADVDNESTPRQGRRGAVLGNQREVEADMMLPIMIRSTHAAETRRMVRDMTAIMKRAKGTFRVTLTDPATGISRYRNVAYREGLRTPEWSSPTTVKYQITADYMDPWAYSSETQEVNLAVAPGASGGLRFSEAQDTSYEWLGDPHNAPSARYDFGEETARNLAVNPQMHASGPRMGSTNSSTIFHLQPYSTQLPVMSPEGTTTGMTVDTLPNAGLNVSVYDVDRLGDTEVFRWGGLWMYTTFEALAELSFGDQDGEPTPVRPHEWTWVTSPGSMDGWSGLRVFPASGTPQPDHKVYWTNLMVGAPDTPYFDGNKPGLQSSGGLRFPLSFARTAQATDRLAVNYGDNPAPVTLRFFGPVSNPEVELIGHWRFGINGTLAWDQYLEIDTTDMTRPTAYVLSTTGRPPQAAFDMVRPESRFSDLVVPPGEHVFSFRGDDSTYTASVTATWPFAYASMQ